MTSVSKIDRIIRRKDSTPFELSFSSVNKYYIAEIKEFFTEERCKQIKPFLENNKKKGGSDFVPLKIFDWFVTKYSKNTNLILYGGAEKGWTSDKKKHVGGDEPFHVHSNYKSMLKGSSKQQFDPFRRGQDNFIFYYTDNQYLKSSIRQLRFFKWILENGLLSYIVKHCDKINKHLQEFKKIKKEKKADEKVKTNSKKKLKISTKAYIDNLQKEMVAEVKFF